MPAASAPKRTDGSRSAQSDSPKTASHGFMSE
jgi:hypothetical protein